MFEFDYRTLLNGSGFAWISVHSSELQKVFLFFLPGFVPSLKAWLRLAMRWWLLIRLPDTTGSAWFVADAYQPSRRSASLSSFLFCFRRSPSGCGCVARRPPHLLSAGLLVVTEFYWTWWPFHWVSPSFTGLYRILEGWGGSDQVADSFTRLY